MRAHTIKSKHGTVLPVIALLFLSCQVRAQLDMRIILDPATLKFFDQNSDFSAKAEFITDQDGKPDIMPVKISILGNLTRLEMDITKEQGGKSSDEAMQGYNKDMKTAGSAESVSIFNPDKKSTFLILPNLKLYLQTPIPETVIEEIKNRPHAEEIELGEGTIDGRTCKKRKIKFAEDHTSDVWRTSESPSAIVWFNQDAPAVPLRLDLVGSDGRTNGTFLMKEVVRGKVDKKLFEPPKGFTKCDKMDELLKVIMEHWPKEKAQ